MANSPKLKANSIFYLHLFYLFFSFDLLATLLHPLSPPLTSWLGKIRVIYILGGHFLGSVKFTNYGETAEFFFFSAGDK